MELETSTYLHHGRAGEAGCPGLEAQVVTALATQAGQAPEWVRLLPLGDVPLGDDREPLWVDQEALAAMVAHFQARGLDLVVDYEHQTLSGSKAPAAGWIKELEIRIAGETPAPQDGLYARVEWTATAEKHLAAREYRYFSPVLRLEDKTRRPLALALVWPILDAFDPDTLCSPVFGTDFRAAMFRLSDKMNELERKGLIPERE
jgi:hypothetical protein